MVRQSHPMGFLGRLEAIMAPTNGKIRNEAPANWLPKVRSTPQPLGKLADRASKNIGMLSTYSAAQRAASDHASQEAARVLIPPTTLPCSFVASVTTPLYITTVSRTLRRTLRG